MPSAYVFDPTGAELVEGYLIPKLKGQKLPSNCIVDLDNIYQYDPHHLLYNSKFQTIHMLLGFDPVHVSDIFKVV